LFEMQLHFRLRTLKLIQYVLKDLLS